MAILACGAAAWWYESSLAEARLAVAAGRFDEARPRLVRLASWWPGRGDVEYPLGICEQAAGHLDAAVAAWSRVPPTFQAGRGRGAEAGRGRDGPRPARRG